MDAETARLRSRMREFVDGEVIPREGEVRADPSRLGAVCAALRERARAAGLFLPHLPADLGGMGLSWVELAEALEEAGRSLLGPLALNAAAPDEGNMHLLHHLATPAQRGRYLAPLARGEVRSCFLMTEPPPGAGSDPSMLRATAERRGDRWVLNGRKWFATGAAGAAFGIALARAPEGPTMFLVDAASPGFRLRRMIRTVDGLTPGGHGEVDLTDCEAGEDAVLGEAGKGFEYAQLRLDPARLTHCMRWTGVAVRALEIAVRYAAGRESFGRRLAEHQGVQWMIADSAIEIHAARLMIRDAAARLDRGERVRHEASMAKVFVSETADRVVDRAIQVCGALGVSDDTPLGDFYRGVRAFRIYDGPSEVHRMSIARRIIRRAEG